MADETAIEWADSTANLWIGADYRARTYRGRSYAALHRAMVSGAAQREGRVLGHARLREHVWNLVAKALAGMGYGGPPQ